MTVESTDLPQENASLSTNRDRSQIEDFFKNTNVLITGGTGFLGNVLLEKLLRCCRGIKKIHLLVRPRKGKDVAERVEEIFNGPIFKALRSEVPDCLQRVACVSGDMELPDCGLSEEDQEMLRREINVVFHAAATVRFDADLRSAVNINVRATKDLLNIARHMENLKAFVHVSTAFTNCLHEVIREDFYDPPLPDDATIRLIEKVDDDFLQQLTPILQGSWPNTYVFTKCIAEDVVRKLGENMPVVVVRPGIVISVAKAPIRGWINNVYGPMGFTAGNMMGILRTCHADVDCAAELVPVDYVINAIIASAWHIGTTFDPGCNSLKNGLTTSKNHLPEKKTDLGRGSDLLLQDSSRDQKKCSTIPVYNIVSSNQNKLTWGNFVAWNETIIADVPLKAAIWCSIFVPFKSKFALVIFTYLLHVIPAVIFDGFCVLIGKKPRLLKISRKIDKMTSYVSFFSTKQWKFRDDNLLRLWEHLNDTDREQFYFDLRDLDWKEYFYYFVLGIREHVLGEPQSTIAEGRKRRSRFLAIHYTLVLILFLICAQGTYLVFSSLRPYFNLT